MALVRWARAVMRRVRSGASESIASTRYSKWVTPDELRSWVSSTPGSSSTTAIRRSQASRSVWSSHWVSMAQG